MMTAVKDDKKNSTTITNTKGYQYSYELESRSVVQKFNSATSLLHEALLFGQTWNTAFRACETHTPNSGILTASLS